MRRKITAERLAQFVLWIALCLVLLSLWRQHSRESQSYRCIITVEPNGHARGNEILCFQADGTMFRPERRFNRFTLADGEQ